MESMSLLEIVEVGPRDGLQNEDAVLDVAARVAYIEALAAAGLRRIEAVSFVHPARVPQMAGAEAVMAAVPRPDGVRYSGLVLNPSPPRTCSTRSTAAASAPASTCPRCSPRPPTSSSASGTPTRRCSAGPGCSPRYARPR